MFVRLAGTVGDLRVEQDDGGCVVGRLDDGGRAGDADLWGRVVYLPADRDELLRRLAERNQREDANALRVTPEALDDFFARFDPPETDEEVIVYRGDLDALLAALTAT